MTLYQQNSVKIITGDFNTQISKDDDQGTTGWHRLHKELYDNSEQLTHFAASKNMTTRSTSFPHKEIQQANKGFARWHDISSNRTHFQGKRMGIKYYEYKVLERCLVWIFSLSS
jgi:succinylarginine dihydrolase